MYKAIVEFIRELYQTPSALVPLHEPRFLGNEKKYLSDTIDSTFVSSVGTYVNLFEDKIAAIVGTNFAVAVANGTCALHIALKLTGVERNEEVLTQPLTFVATANAISYLEAIPHFVDVDNDTLGLSPDSLKERLETIAEVKNGLCFNKKTGRRIRACVPMHTFGFPSRINELASICNEYNIPIVEDAAESLGSYYREKHTGSFGLLGILSFNGNKIATSGGGGAIVTNDEKLAKRAKHITTTAKVSHPWEYSHYEIGYNYRMPNLNAALACAQLEQLHDFLENKRATAKKYREFFKSLSGVKYLEEPKNTRANYWLNAIQFNDKTDREEFLQYSNEKDVMTRPIWRLMNKLPMFRHCPFGDLSNAEHLESTVVNIPSSVRL